MVISRLGYDDAYELGSERLVRANTLQRCEPGGTNRRRCIRRSPDAAQRRCIFGTLSVDLWRVALPIRGPIGPGSAEQRYTLHRVRDTRHTSPQPLIARVLCALACRLDGFLGRTLAAGKLQCFAAG